MNFVQLFQMLDTNQSTNAKRNALVEFIGTAHPLESALAIEALKGRRQRRQLKPSLLKQAAYHAFADEGWLFEECYAAVGDLSETLAILFANQDAVSQTEDPVLSQWRACQLELSKKEPEELMSELLSLLSSLSRDEAFLFLKLSSGGFRVGVSKGLVHDAIARAIDMDRAVIEERLMGEFTADESWLDRLKEPVTQDELDARPLPFLLANPLSESDALALDPDSVAVEYKWDGIRAQLIKTHEIIRLWSRGDQDITAQFPDIVETASTIPSHIILDGEILAGTPEQLQTFNKLQTRLNRKRITQNLLKTHPTFFKAYDLLRLDGEDMRDEPLIVRKDALGKINIIQSQVVYPASNQDIQAMRQGARAAGAEGVMIKHRHSNYTGGRKAGYWWKWKLDPMTADCVLIYAQAGHGRRASLHSDYTLACWNQHHELVPVAKAYSGLTDAELKEMDQWIRKHTLQKFGPVRQVEALQVFEIGFEGLARSTRHKSGIALRFPRILRWRQDVGPEDADHLSHFEILMGDFHAI
jgi:DNA ligase-1